MQAVIPYQWNVPESFSLVFAGKGVLIRRPVTSARRLRRRIGNAELTASFFSLTGQSLISLTRDYTIEAAQFRALRTFLVKSGSFDDDVVQHRHSTDDAVISNFDMNTNCETVQNSGSRSIIPAGIACDCRWIGSPAGRQVQLRLERRSIDILAAARSPVTSRTAAVVTGKRE